MKRVFLIVLDSFGVGALPDAAAYGDAGADTLGTLLRSGLLRVPHMQALGLFDRQNKAAERSPGKDTTTGHWEMAGLVLPRPFPTYPEGFPPRIMEAFTRKTGFTALCNKPFSGTKVLEAYGMEHLRTGQPIVYTSADSVFQIAAHEERFGLERLYALCEQARALLQGEDGVGRVIARPFTGDEPPFTRTPHRHDYSLPPCGPTMLDAIVQSREVIAIGKIRDIFAGRGVTRAFPTENNAQGMELTRQWAQRDFTGLCFTNLVDFDMVYGHRRDIAGYARALNEFDAWLGGFLPLLGNEDALIITADHGCDPGYSGTDHTREYVPLLCFRRGRPALNAGLRESFADTGATVCRLLGIKASIPGVSYDDIFQ